LQFRFFGVLQIHYNIEDFSAKNPVITVGIFDGVHRGHKYIIQELIDIAEKKGGEPVVLTLWPHPRLILNYNISGIRLITTLDEKIEILSDFDIKHLIVINFTKKFSRMSSGEFIERILVEKIGIRHLVMGYNHKFGSDCEGNIRQISKYAERFHFTVEKLRPYKNGNMNISSSVIRQTLMRGEIDLANELLGHRFFISGKVIGGTRVGRSIGFPTANVKSEHRLKLLPADGVYAVRVLIGGARYPGMLNIGIRPTVNHNPEHKTIEVHIIDFDKDIYDQDIRIDLVARIRDEMRFDSVDMLRNQLIKDKENVMGLISKLEGK